MNKIVLIQPKEEIKNPYRNKKVTYKGQQSAVTYKANIFDETLEAVYSRIKPLDIEKLAKHIQEFINNHEQPFYLSTITKVISDFIAEQEK